MKKLIILLSISISLFSCAEPDQFIYEGINGLIIYEKEIQDYDSKDLFRLQDKSRRGQYLYRCKDLTGNIIVWSNSSYNVGDTLFLMKKR